MATELPLVLEFVLIAGIPAYILLFVVVTFFMWAAYIRVGRTRFHEKDTCTRSLTEEAPDDRFLNFPHQHAETQLLHEIFERCFPPCFLVFLV